MRLEFQCFISFHLFSETCISIKEKPEFKDNFFGAGGHLVFWIFNIFNS